MKKTLIHMTELLTHAKPELIHPPVPLVRACNLLLLSRMEASMMRRAVPVLTLFLSFALACSSSTADGPVQVEPGGDVRTFNGLTEMGTGFFGNTKPRGNGRFEIGSTGVLWFNERGSSRNISLRPDVIKRVWLTCASKPGANLCLDLGIQTLTGQEHHFRDTNWEGGVNTVILAAYDHMKSLYPQVQFDQKTVNDFE